MCSLHPACQTSNYNVSDAENWLGTKHDGVVYVQGGNLGSNLDRWIFKSSVLHLQLQF